MNEQGKRQSPPYATVAQIEALFERMGRMGDPGTVDKAWVEKNKGKIAMPEEAIRTVVTSVPEVTSAAAVTVVSWVIDADERERLRAYAVTLGGGTAIAFLVFASNDNWGDNTNKQEIVDSGVAPPSRDFRTWPCHTSGAGRFSFRPGTRDRTADRRIAAREKARPG